MLSTLDLTGFFLVPGFHQQPHPTPTSPTLALLISTVTKISSCQVNAIKRQGIEQVGRFFILFSVWFLSKWMGVVLIVARGRPHPLALSNSSVWEGKVKNREEREMAWKSTEEGDLPFCTSLLLSDVSDFPFKLPCAFLRNKSGIFDKIKSYRDFFSMQLITLISFRTWK